MMSVTVLLVVEESFFHVFALTYILSLCTCTTLIVVKQKYEATEIEEKVPQKCT